MSTYHQRREVLILDQPGNGGEETLHGWNLARSVRECQRSLIADAESGGEKFETKLMGHQPDDLSRTGGPAQDVGLAGDDGGVIAVPAHSDESDLIEKYSI